MTRLSCCLLLLAALSAFASGDIDADAPRFTARVPATIEAGAQHAGRFTLKARFAALETGGELRESGRFSVIGRIAAKGALTCGAPDIFADGFEGR